MAFAQKLFTSFHNYQDPDTRIGELNRIWYDSKNNVFRIQLDRTTPGGTQIGGSGSNYTLPTASTTILGGIKIDGTTITINNGIISYTLPTASTTTLGGIKIDNSTLTYNGSGQLKANYTNYVLPTASDTVLGGVKIDNSTITYNINGQLQSNYIIYTLPKAQAFNAGNVLGGVIPDGTTITVNNNGVISAVGTGAVVFKGAWNASTNTGPTISTTGLVDGVTPQQGWEYIVSVTGTKNIGGGGTFTYTAGDLILYDGTKWVDIPGTGSTGTVTSVSATGSVSGISISTGGSPITSSGTITLSGTVSGLTYVNLSSTANIANSQLANSTIQLNGVTLTLGDTGKTIKATATNALTIGTGLSGTSFDGSSAVTIAIDSSVATLTGTQTLTNKTLTSPTINDPTFAGTFAFTSTNTTTPAMTLTASSLNDGVGIMRFIGSEPDINFNQVAASPGFNTFTFEYNGDPKIAMGRRNDHSFYITRNNGGWQDNTFVLDYATGVLSVPAGITANLSGNATTATTLQTARNINGVAFDGSAAITVTAAAGTLTGTTLNSTVVNSSLTSVGTLTGLTVSGTSGSSVANTNSAGGVAFTITSKPFLPVGDQVWTFRSGTGLGAPASWMGWPDGSIQQTAWTGTADASTLTGTTLNSTVVNSSLTSVGTLANLTVTNTITGSVSGNAGTATKLATARAINGVNFDGSAAITVTADATTLTGATLKSTVVNSSLTSLGLLTSLTSAGTVTFTDTTNSSNTTTGALQVRGGVGVLGNIYLGGGINSAGVIVASNGVTVSYNPVNPTGQAMTISGKDTVGGTGYFDFFRVTNNTSGATAGTKTFRLNSTGTLEILNNAYNATILSVTDAGFIAINASSSATNGIPVNNGIAMNANSYIFDDGNYHITSKTGSIWLNANDGSAVNINTQMPSGITGGGLNVQGAVKSYGAGGAATAFISSGANVISGVALQMDSGTAGTAANMAVRDTSTVASTMYFDVSTGGSANGTFRFRSSNSFNEILALSNTTVTVNKQMLIGGGSQGAYVTITSTNSYNLNGPYGYLAGGGAGSVGGGGSSGTVGWSLQCIGRIQVGEIDATSDERLKDIQGTIPLDRALQFVRAVDGILYTWKPGFGDEGLKSGFGAQSVHKAGFDHMIAPIPNDRVEGTVDDDGWTHPDKVQLTIGYNQAIPYHHEVIKHLLDRIEQLEATVAKLTK